jgi:GTP pyrophosphokinase
MRPQLEIPHDWEDTDDLHRLFQKLRDTRPDADIKKIRYAYYVAEKAHSGQVRKSGLPYILHPVAVAEILVDLGMDDNTICAALLHDVVEDSEMSLEQMRDLPSTEEDSDDEQGDYISSPLWGKINLLFLF